MKPKQLANILIRILGLSLIVRALPGFLSGILMVILNSSPAEGGAFFLPILPTVVAAVVELALGFLLVTKSRKITACLFKDEAE